MSLDLVIFGEDWGGLPSSTQHLTRHLIELGHRVLWVNSIGLRRPKLTDAGRVIRKLCAAMRQPTERSGKLQSRASDQAAPAAILNPLAPPAPCNQIERSLARLMLGRQVKRAMAQIGMTRPILWSSLPSAAIMLGTCGERAVVYYCGDDFGDLVGVDHGPVLAFEQELARAADLVLTSSPSLTRRFAPGNVETIQHGVDYSLFATPTAPAPSIPHGAPTAGFYGSIADWLDRDLIAEVATRMPEWHFQFVGAIDCDLGRLNNLKNVTFEGAVPHHVLPSFSQHWTAALLPFRDTPQIRACNPLKLREYLAAGAPIVATPFPAVEAYSDIVRIAETPADFAAAIAASQADQPEQRVFRRARVANETWRNRAETVEKLLYGLPR
jgi:glycosyltransferase involved in cell wall biosynthesis